MSSNFESLSAKSLWHKRAKSSRAQRGGTSARKMKPLCPNIEELESRLVPVTIDFEGLPASTGNCPSLDPRSVITDNFQPLGVVFGRAGVSAGIAAVQFVSLAPSSGVNTVVGLDAGGLIPGVCEGDIFFRFESPGTTTPTAATSFSFTIGDSGGDLDIFQIRSYDQSDRLIDVQNPQGFSRFQFSRSIPTGVHRVEVDWRGTGGGYSLDDLQFELIPQPQPGGPYTVNEGDSIQLAGSGAGFEPLTFAWDLDGDDLFGETSAAAARGDETGANPTFSAAGLDGPSSRTVQLRTTDRLGNTAASLATINVVNVAPTASAGGPYSVAEPSTVVLTGSGSDPAGANDPLTFEWDLDGDGVSGKAERQRHGAMRTCRIQPSWLPAWTGRATSRCRCGHATMTVV